MHSETTTWVVSPNPNSAGVKDQTLDTYILCPHVIKHPDSQYWLVNLQSLLTARHQPLILQHRPLSQANIYPNRSLIFRFSFQTIGSVLSLYQFVSQILCLTALKVKRTKCFNLTSNQQPTSTLHTNTSVRMNKTFKKTINQTNISPSNHLQY